MDQRTVFVMCLFIYWFPIEAGVPYVMWSATAPAISVLMLLAVSPRRVVPASALPPQSASSTQIELGGVNLGTLSVLVVLFTVMTFLPQRFLFRLQRQQRSVLQTLAAESRAQLLLLKRVIPDVFIDQLFNPTKRITSEAVPYVTVLFCEVMVINTDAATGAQRPTKLGVDLQESTLSVLSAVFRVLEAVVERNGVFKVETIFSEFMAVAGLPLARQHHNNTTYAMVLTALDMVREVNAALESGRLAELAGGMQIRLQIGINTGPCVESILGRKLLPRWKLFGDTVNTASRMKSNGVLGRINLSRAAKAHLLRDALPMPRPIDVEPLQLHRRRTADRVRRMASRRDEVHEGASPKTGSRTPCRTPPPEPSS